MSIWDTVQVGSFLNEREDRFEPDEANKLGLKRLEKIDFSGNIHLNGDKPTRTGMILVKKGDLVISGINVEKGAIAVYQGEEDVLATIHYSSYKFDKSKIDVGYFTWFLRSQTFKDIVQSQVRGGIKTELKPKHFLPLKINLPDLPTQQEIKKRINNVSNEIKEINELDVKNEDYVTKLRQSILQEAVQGKLVPQEPKDEPASVLLEKIKAEKERLIQEKKIRKEKPLPAIKEDEIPFELPKGWEWIRLKTITTPQREITYGIVKMGTESPNGVKVLRCSDVKYRRINHSGARTVSNQVSNVYSRTILQGGELLMNVRGTLGGVAIVPLELKGHNIAREVALISVVSQINTRYILDVLSSPLIQKNTFDSLRGIAYKGLNLNLLSNFLIPLPPLNEQKRIVEKVDQVIKLCDELEEKVKENQKNADLLMEAVLREAFEVKESGPI